MKICLLVGEIEVMVEVWQGTKLLVLLQIFPQ